MLSKIRSCLLFSVTANLSNHYDAFSGWVELAPLVNYGSADVALAFWEHWCLNHGPVYEILSDRGEEFSGAVYRDLLAKMRVRHLQSSGHRPQTNGKCERVNKEVNNLVRAYYQRVQGHWHEMLKWVQFILNTTRTSNRPSAWALHKGCEPPSWIEMLLDKQSPFTGYEVSRHPKELREQIEKLR